jgi:hypothetical protein
MAKTRTLKPTRKGQKPITFKEGAGTAQAKRLGYSSFSAMCRNPPNAKAAKRCSFAHNVLTGRKK